MTDDELNLAAAKLLGRVFSLDEYEQSDEADFTGFTDCGNLIMDNRTMDGFHPATEIADAMRVVEHLRAKGVDLDIMARRGEWKIAVFSATVLDIEDVYVCDPSLPRALTLAAVRSAATPGAGGA